MSIVEATKYDDAFWERLGARPRRPPLIEFTEEVDLFVARRVKTARVHAGLRQKDLAAAIGLTVTQISRLERGHRSLTVPELLRIAVQTRRPVSYFIEPPDPQEVVRTGWEKHPARSLWDQLRDLD
ncbi:MAG: helix-turn-helix transcriptional regulator [Actinomycetota bacterium]